MKNILQSSITRIKGIFKLVAYSTISFLFIATVFSSWAHAAPAATLTLSPASQNVTNGSSVSLTITINAGSNRITGAQACITYDSSKLTLTNTDTSGSQLTYTTPGSSADCSAGQIQVSRFDVTQPTGTITLGVIKFDAKAAGTTAILAFDNAKSYVKDNATTDANGNYVSILSGSTGSTLTLNAPAAAPPSPTPSSPPATNTSPTGTVTPAPDTSKKQPPITDTTHPTTPNSPIKAPAQAASADVKQAPITTSQTASKTSPKKATSHKVVYIVSGAIIVALIAAGLIIKFIGTSGLPVFGTRKAQQAAGSIPPINTTSSTLSNIPDPQLPTPSSVVQPTQPPSRSENQRPHEL